MTALTGIRVVDLSRFIAGPLCAQLLADQGADVIKVERPGGEDSRHLGAGVNGETLYAMAYNRNKRGITLDTRHPEAKRVLEELIAASDVLVENYRPGTLDAMGLTAERLEELNPRLVICSLSGFGQTGPLAQRALFDPIAQAMSGLMSLTGTPDAPPTLTGAFVADYMTGVYGALGTMFALHARESTGRGQRVDIGSLDVTFSALGTTALGALNLGTRPVRTGSRDQLSGPANVFASTDGWLFIHAGTDALFARLVDAIGDDGLDAQWLSLPGRMADIDAVERWLGAWVGGRGTEEVSRILTQAGIPFSPVLDLPEAIALPQLGAREMIVPTEHARAGTVKLIGTPVKLSGTPAAPFRGAPFVGEHTEEVLRDVLERDDAQIAALRESGAV